MPTLFLLIGCIANAGCGPMLFPAVQRLDPGQQKEVDQTWLNLLTPTGKVDRETLLDVLILYQLHQNGIDGLSLIAEKDLPDGRRVTLEMKYDRANPGVDSFAVKVFNSSGQLSRFEAYTNEEVLRHVNEFGGSPSDPANEKRDARLLEARLERVRAATQPSTAVH